MARPRPWPDTSDCPADWLRTKGSKMRSRSCAGIPFPSFSTESTNSPSSVIRAEMPIAVLAGEYLIAFWMRFASTRSI